MKKEFSRDFCSFKPTAQLNLFTGEAEPICYEIEMDSAQSDEINLNEGISIVKSGDSSMLIVSGYGIFLGKKSERLVIRQDDKAIYEIPFFRINEIVIDSRGVSLSSDLIHELCLRGIKLNFLTRNGQPYAMISSPFLTATIISRREQIKAIDDRRGLEFAKIIVRGKIKNQEGLLRYFGKYLKQSSPDKYIKISSIADKLKSMRHKVDLVEGANVEEARETLYGIEGNSGRLYWSGIKEIISGRVEFFKRVHQGAIDVVNMLLNYGYGILYSVVWGAILNAGLEPFAGFLHTDRPGKPSLVLDLVEEFRQPVVDRVVIAHINLGQAVKIKEGLLDPDTRKLIGSKILERLDSPIKFQNKTYKLRSIIQIQARNLVSFLRGESTYKTFSFKW